MRDPSEVASIFCRQYERASVPVVSAKHAIMSPRKGSANEIAAAPAAKIARCTGDRGTRCLAYSVANDGQQPSLLLDILRTSHPETDRGVNENRSVFLFFFSPEITFLFHRKVYFLYTCVVGATLVGTLHTHPRAHTHTHLSNISEYVSNMYKLYYTW